MINFYQEYINNVKTALDQVKVTDYNGKEYNINQAFDIWATKAKEIRDNLNGLLFFCGNGASASMAEHMSHDWFQNAKVNTTTNAETAHITAISNDLSYEDVFSYRIERILSEKDMLIGISSSGNSPNIVKAIVAGRKKGAFIITVSGKEKDNQIRQMGHLNFHVELGTYGLVESAHAVLIHSALDYFLQKYMGGMH
jgi:D-sedoheptulose 7-phosphate isomerase